MSESDRIVPINEIKTAASTLVAMWQDLLRARAVRPAGSCDTLCNCNHSYCVCRGPVQDPAHHALPIHDFLAQQEGRLRDLRIELQAVLDESLASREKP